MDAIRPYLPFLVPILILQVGLMLFALIDLIRRPAANGPRWLWAFIIIFVNIIGPIAYFLIGRREE
ncbi:Negative regulatory protein YxlE [Candidatus Promineifilum breve]|uniref:Negative regulatory protein YxlE n=1 Tax=Candidatus Promineifilum breve TaxID=1806508 RepID=A0A160T4R6_9CHLR|nr:PLD nuclease N-terminal domain-containing protein [Candidatus Promineifilum breve]CUS04098.2 Negative regulatory protein YxlE [Candidatus Promineifilum breve]